MKNLKKWLALLLLAVLALSLTACGSNNDTGTPAAAPAEAPAAAADSGDTAAAPASEGQAAEAAPVSDHPLSATYGFQWMDPTAPILNEKGAQELSFKVYSSKNASALDYNDIRPMCRSTGRTCPSPFIPSRRT